MRAAAGKGILVTVSRSSPRSNLVCNHDFSRAKGTQISPREPSFAISTSEQVPMASPLFPASMLLLTMTRMAWLFNQRTSLAPWHMHMKTRSSTFPDYSAWDLAHPMSLLYQIVWATTLSSHCLLEIEERLSPC